MAENAEKTAAVVVEKLANAHARGKTATVVSGRLAEIQLRDIRVG